MFRVVVDSKKVIERVQGLLQSSLDAGVRRSELAEALKTTRASIGDWLKGKYPPKPENLAIIAEYYGVDTLYLSGVEEPSSVDLAALGSALRLAKKAHEELGSAIRQMEDGMRRREAAASTPPPPVKPRAPGGEETLDEALARYGHRLSDFQELYQRRPGVLWTVIRAADRGEPNAADALDTMAMPTQVQPGEKGEAARHDRRLQD